MFEHDGEICTLENMTPDWIRICDGKFFDPVDTAKSYTKNPVPKEVSIRKLYKAVILKSEAIELEIESINKAAEYLGRHQAILSNAIKHGYRVKSHIDGVFYTIRLAKR